MATITLKGNTLQTAGELPEIGSKAPDFELVKNDLSTATLKDFEGFNLILNIFPSVDTGICAASVREFNKQAASLTDTKVVCISRDLPFAQERFCGAEGIENVINLSDFRTGKFGKDYEVEMTSGPLKALHSRAIVVLDKEGTVRYTEQVPEIVQEPDYTAALNALK
ncbi:thiol peroxidase [Aquimarina intermedia]|uniref:Thiol peroxidase n=1 Tax=Aquimarina intermedia TaxID=350814 RepID=A0A5S5C6S9_9FLAO|nr:thiol peroxidase [Aquimarina intermedia]TYP74308.1 thiol peroxidase (atypical 2-Cys peroxiredoxin) [Aquimarina intermedia]